MFETFPREFRARMKRFMVARLVSINYALQVLYEFERNGRMRFTCGEWIGVDPYTKRLVLEGRIQNVRYDQQ